MIPMGLTGRADDVVTPAKTAGALVPGAAQVFGTPFMIAMMEAAAYSAMTPCLAPGQSSVGASLQVSHAAATPIGMRVWAEAEVIEVDRKKVVFQVKAYDEAGLIGQGTHTRFIIDLASFLTKVEEKKQEFQHVD